MAQQSPSSPKPETGPEIIDKMAAEPSADRFFMNQPNFTDAELKEFIDIQRRERALWETKKK